METIRNLCVLNCLLDMEDGARISHRLVIPIHLLLDMLERKEKSGSDLIGNQWKLMYIPVRG